MPTPEQAILTAVYTIVNVSSVTSIATGGVHNGLQQTSTFPFVRFGDVQESPHEFMGRFGENVIVRFHIFDNQRTDNRIAQVSSALKTLLHYQTFTVTGWQLTCSQWQQGYPAGNENINGVEVRHKIAEIEVSVLP